MLSRQEIKNFTHTYCSQPVESMFGFILHSDRQTDRKLIVCVSRRSFYRLPSSIFYFQLWQMTRCYRLLPTDHNIRLETFVCRLYGVCYSNIRCVEHHVYRVELEMVLPELSKLVVSRSDQKRTAFRRLVSSSSNRQP
jgi:hypothetical protein